MAGERLRGLRAWMAESQDAAEDAGSAPPAGVSLYRTGGWSQRPAALSWSDRAVHMGMWMSMGLALGTALALALRRMRTANANADFVGRALALLNANARVAARIGTPLRAVGDFQGALSASAAEGRLRVVGPDRRAGEAVVSLAATFAPADGAWRFQRLAVSLPPPPYVDGSAGHDAKPSVVHVV
jgi:hypothetical protein